MTEVVAALIWDGDKFMACQRPAHKARGLKWEFVGGKVEPGETKEQALIRECREELAVTVSVGEVFMDVVHEYLCRHRLRDGKGRITDVEYIIYEQPHLRPPDPEYPHPENPDMGEPDQEKPSTEKPTQIKKEENKYRRKANTDAIKYPSISPDRMDERRTYEAIIKENLDFDLLCESNRYEQERLREIVDIMLDAICSQSPTIRINGEDMPQQVVKSRFLKLTSMHIEYVFDAMRDNPSDIHNIRAYLLTALYNAALTIDNYYSAKVNHDLYGVPDSSGTPFFHVRRKEDNP